MRKRFPPDLIWGFTDVVRSTITEDGGVVKHVMMMMMMMMMTTTTTMMMTKIMIMRTMMMTTILLLLMPMNTKKHKYTFADLHDGFIDVLGGAVTV